MGIYQPENLMSIYIYIYINNFTFKYPKIVDILIYRN